MSDLDRFQGLIAALLHNIAPANRKKILRIGARDVRKSQAARIARQQDPDGNAFAPRREKPTSRASPPARRIRQKQMFKKLRLAKSLKAGASDNEAWVGFAGRAAAIARVHQEGRADSPSPGQPKVRYARRVLLGLSDAEYERMIDIVLDNVAP